ncbi:MAG: hypothetical protein COV57_01960 [Candidatus Liptonbacteria bacterium CG11_big_fil_rev_8_21_14_0_20_35_14]|uniref:Uncharacterized protein n=1 Tax=Candidatus Liptonbacteria bacterium CG11_big_fil_rev_8_21_14_0_20_35_14 TaxID=1974634 RepID=A0A2H0N9V5_9BACT|nr:MAG: hypothetical protein COV57_01960 [Candidatus Liptonbacteria bacterium CG11_big_fil_rev_8_21_14_0_20_35_14]
MSTFSFLFRKNNAGFTLVEVLVYAGVFTVVSGLMVGVFSSVSDIQQRELAKSDISQQSQFVMGAIKRAVSESSAINMTNDESGAVLTLLVEDNTKSPTLIYVENGVVFKKEGSNAPTPLSNNKVSFDSISFVKTANPPGPDTVRVDFTISYNSDVASLSNLTSDYRSAISRVSAVTFDSDLLPSSDGTYNVGSSNPKWLNAFFSGSVNVGTLLNLGTASSDPSGQNGSLYYNTTSSVIRAYVGGAWADLGSSGSGDGTWSSSGSNVYRSSGSVGIGTALIPNTLTVTGTASISGNVGVGDTTPDHKLDVAGNIGLDAGSYINYGDTDGTTGYGLRDNLGTLELKNSGGSWVAIPTSSGVVGSGTASYVAKFSGTSTVSNSLIYDNGTNVGIGTTGPDRKFDLLDALNPQLRLTQSDGTVYADFQTTSNGDLVINVDGISNQLVLDNGGDIGIGTTMPKYKLDLGSGTFGTTGTLFATTTYFTTLNVGTSNGFQVSSAGTVTAGTWNGTALDLSTYTNLTAGRSLTLTNDDVLADAELYTHIDTIVLESPAITDDAIVQHKFPTAVTISRISCSTDVGTATIQFDERAEGTPNTAGTDVMTSALVCDANSEATTLFGNAGIAADAVLSLDIDAVATSPGVVRIHIDYSFDD